MGDLLEIFSSSPDMYIHKKITSSAKKGSSTLQSVRKKKEIEQKQQGEIEEKAGESNRLSN